MASPGMCSHDLTSGDGRLGTVGGGTVPSTLAMHVWSSRVSWLASPLTASIGMRWHARVSGTGGTGGSVGTSGTPGTVGTPGSVVTVAVKPGRLLPLFDTAVTAA